MGVVLKFALRQRKVVPVSETRIRVDRRIPQTAPVDYISEFVESETTQAAAPWVYDIRDLTPWVYEPETRGEYYEAGAALERLRCSRFYERALDTRDAAQIIARGANFYRQHFGEANLVLWRGQAYDRARNRMLPHLRLYREGLTVSWRWMTEKLDPTYITRLRPH